MGKGRGLEVLTLADAAHRLTTTYYLLLTIATYYVPRVTLQTARQPRARVAWQG